MQLRGELFGEFANPVRISRYEVQEVLGRGGMGVVYSAWDPVLGRTVALKLLEGTSGSPKRTRRMVREAQALAKVSHPNVVHVYEVGEHEQDVFVAMELVEGPSLKDWARERKRSIGEIESVFLQAGEGLSAAHRAGLVHRDFKPSNVIVGKDGRVRVVDFGLAHGPGLTGDSTDPVSVADSPDKLTQTGAVLGTPAYMAPEQIRGEAADARADQFSFCVSLFETLAGVRPYRFEELRDRSTSASFGSSNAIPRRWRGPLQIGLALAPRDRWPDMDALLAALRGRRWRGRTPLFGALGLGLLTLAPLLLRDEEPCDGLSSIPAGWDAERDAKIGDAFKATDAPFALDVWRSSRAQVEDFSRTWLEVRAEVCRARPDESAVGCLRNAEIVLDAVLTQYESVERENVATVHPLASLLESPASCIAPERGFSRDLDPARAEPIAKATAQFAANNPWSAIETATDVIEAPDYQNTDARAEMLVLRGRARAALADNEGAFADLVAGVVDSGSKVMAARASISRLRVLMELEHFETARDDLRFVEALLPSPTPPGMEADFLELRALIKTEESLDSRLSDLEKALELRVEAGAPLESSSTRMSTANLLAESEEATQLERARTLYEEELATRRETLGASHPLTATAMFNLGVFIADTKQDWAEALELFRGADQIEGRNLPPSAPGRARTRLKIGEALIRLDRFEEARLMLDSAWSTLEALPESHTDRIAARTLLAYFTMETKDYSASLAHHRALAEIHPEDPFVQQNLAFISVQLGDAVSAQAAVTKARGLVILQPIDDATQRLLELYFRTIDAHVARLEERDGDALRIVEEVEAAARQYSVPEGRPDLAEQLSRLQPELDAVRAKLGPPSE